MYDSSQVTYNIDHKDKTRWRSYKIQGNSSGSSTFVWTRSFCVCHRWLFCFLFYLFWLIQIIWISLPTVSGIIIILNTLCQKDVKTRHEKVQIVGALVSPMNFHHYIFWRFGHKLMEKKYEKLYNMSTKPHSEYFLVRPLSTLKDRKVFRCVEFFKQSSVF